MTKDEIQAEFDKLRRDYDNAEIALVNFALEHKIELHVDGMGMLLLEDDSWSGKSAGEWYTSTDSCS